MSQQRLYRDTDGHVHLAEDHDDENSSCRVLGPPRVELYSVIPQHLWTDLQAMIEDRAREDFWKRYVREEDEATYRRQKL